MTSFKHKNLFQQEPPHSFELAARRGPTRARAKGTSTPKEQGSPGSKAGCRLKPKIENANEDLRDQLQQAQPGALNMQRVLDQQRRVINDIHKHVIAVTKGVQKPAS